MHEKKDKAILPDPLAYLRRRVVATINRVYLRLTKSFPAAPIADIEDSVAEAVAQWWAQRGALDDPRMETWVSMNARWRLLDRLRRVGEHVQLSEHHLVAQGPDAIVERTEILRHAVCVTLSTAMEVVIELAILGWTVREIAAHLQISETAARKRLERAIIRFREAVVEADDRNGCRISPRSFVIRMGDAENQRDDRRKGRKEGRKEAWTVPDESEQTRSRVSGAGLCAKRRIRVVGFPSGGRTGLVVLAAACGMVMLGSGATQAIPLAARWTSQTRGNIQVFLCTASFQQHLPFLDLDLVRANIQNALALWNTYPGVDYRLVWSGDSPDNDGCEPRGNLPSQPGKIAIRAADYGRNQEFAIAVNTYPDIDRAYIEFYRRSGPGAQDRPWGFDHTQNILDFDTVLMHELGHALGFPHHTPPPNSVMKGGLHYTMHRVLWEEDIFKLRDTSQTYHYNLRTNRQIRRKYSTNNGLSWTTGTSLQEYTNANIAVAYDPWSGENLVAWAGAEPAHRVHTLRCNNLTCDPATRVVHSGSSTHYGVAAAGGAGKFLMAWTVTNDTRRIAAKYFSFGSWSPVWYLDYNGTFDYSAMWEPVVAYNYAKQAFLVAWTNWQIADSDDAQGRVRVCVIPLYFGSQRCVELSVVSNTTPGLACHSSNNQCILMWVNHVGYYNNHLSYRQGRINDAGDFELYGTGYYFSGGDIASDLPPSLTHGNGHWVAAWRGKASTLPARAMRMADGNWPYWSDLTVIDTSVQSSPTVAFVGNSFVYYYIKY